MWVNIWLFAWLILICALQGFMVDCWHDFPTLCSICYAVILFGSVALAALADKRARHKNGYS